MRIIISPAKKMKVDTDSFAYQGLPRFIARSKMILERLRELSYEELKHIWRCNDQLAQINFQRVQTMDLYQRLTPALLAYEGIQYQYMAPGVFSTEEFSYVEEHLRILSGFYGVLRPFDGVTPYRLEMQAKLSICEAKDLYGFWGTLIAEEIFSETDCIINLASKEYSRCISAYVPHNVRFVTCIFGEKKSDRIIEKGTQCKMARGEMVRYMAEKQISEPEELRTFDRLGYRFCLERSGLDTYVFLKEDTALRPNGTCWTPIRD